MDELCEKKPDVRVCYIDASRIGTEADKISKDDGMPFIVEAFHKTGKRISEALASNICNVVDCHSWQDAPSLAGTKKKERVMSHDMTPS